MTEKSKSGIPQITAEELSLVGDNALTPQQLQQILRKTPRQYVKTRKGKGGEHWDYVSVSYVQKVLNLMFGWRWDFKVLDYKFDLDIGQCFVHGRLTVWSQGHKIVKEQFGRCDIKFYRDRTLPSGQRMPLDIGNDLKGASSDALKKCASLLGVASDIYGKEDFREIQIVMDDTAKTKSAPKIEKLRHFLSQCTTADEIEFVVETFEEETGREPNTEEQELINQAYQNLA